MKAQPKHLSCIAVSSFHLACSQYQESLPLDTLLVCTPDPADLVSISQSRCSASDLLHQLEILVCDSSTLKFRPCELALALLCTEFQLQCAENPSNTTALMGFISELQKYCHIESSKFVTVLNEVVAILDKY